jgi:very-short-patch-repair endonuclease
MVKLRGREAYPFYFGASATTLKIAADLRKSMTKAEKVLWEKLRDKKCCNFKFRRQHPIGDFVVDFFCYDSMLVIELDGEAHNEKYQEERDQERTKILNEFGITVLRFRNEEVFKNIKAVLEKIKMHLSTSKQCSK